MSRIMRQSLIGITIAAILLSAAAYAKTSESALRTVDLTTLPYEEKTPYWEGRVRDAGADRAYEEFKAAIDSVPRVERHWEFDGKNYRTLRGVWEHVYETVQEFKKKIAEQILKENSENVVAESPVENQPLTN